MTTRLELATARGAGRASPVERAAPPADDVRARHAGRPTAALDPDGTFTFGGRALGSALRLFVTPGTPGTTSPDPRGGVGPRAIGGPASGARAAVLAWEAVRDEFAAVDRSLSRFRHDSELTRLNRLAGTDTIVAVSWRLRTALAAMHRAGRITEGRFDASVLEALERIGEHGADLGGSATADAPASAARAAANDGLRPWLEPRALERPARVMVPARPLDSGGIGKGLALRWAARRAAAIVPGGALLLEAGGDVVAAGHHPAGDWRVGIEDPVGGSEPDTPPIAVVGIQAGAVATSSIAVRNWTAPDGRRVHHLLDPRTGEPARTGLIAVTVAGSDPAWAEVWSKALFLAGRGSIGDEARSRGMAAWWVDDAGHLGMTPEARLRSVWVAEERLG